jgi:AmmeMemoRadiSam system protein B
MTGPLPRVKEAHLAGRWYPGDADVLRRTARALLEAGGAPRPGVVAVLVPHAAWDYSGPTAARGLAAVGPRIRRAVVVGPSHYAAFRGAAVLPMGGYRTPLGVIPIDQDAVAALAARAPLRANPAVFMREHAVEVELPLLQTLAPKATLVPVLVGRLGPEDARRLAEALEPLLGPETALVVSSDLTHYGRRFGYLPVPASDAATVAAAVRRLDDAVLERILAGDADAFARHVEETGATVCGRDAIEALLRLLPEGVRAEALAQATSLDAGDDHEHVVGYAAVAFARAA